MPIRHRRWNDPREEGDGYRLLVCRYRPRGVTREEEPWDAWSSALAPSAELHAAIYGKDGPPISWREYVTRYLAEIDRQRWWIEALAARVRAGETITLLCSSACVDPARCHRTLLAQLVADAAWPAPPPAPVGAGAAAVVRRRRPP